MESVTQSGFLMTAERRVSYTVRRSRLEVQMDILRVVKEGASLPTQIMYRANMAWTTLQEHLKLLVGNGLLDRTNTGSKRLYNVTMKGAGVLEGYMDILGTVRESPAETN